jgi:hypothetical protein
MVNMLPRSRLAGVLTLWGFFACVSWSTGLVSAGCCSGSCAPCPASFCDGTAAKVSQKLDTLPQLVPASLSGIDWHVSVLSEEGFTWFVSSLSPAFQRPMRN